MSLALVDASILEGAIPGYQCDIVCLNQIVVVGAARIRSSFCIHRQVDWALPLTLCVEAICIWPIVALVYVIISVCNTNCKQ